MALELAELPAERNMPVVIQMLLMEDEDGIVEEGLADTIEARIRSIGDPLTPKRVEAEVSETVEKRWRTHQLDDSELTLSDLRKIREAFSRVLIGMYHQRIKYPDQVEGQEDGDRSDGEEPSERSPETGDGD